MRIRTELKLTERERKKLEAVAKELQWTLTETIRHCIMYSLDWILERETKKRLNPMTGQVEPLDKPNKNDKRKHQAEQEEETISDEELDKMFASLGINSEKEDDPIPGHRACR